MVIVVMLMLDIAEDLSEVGQTFFGEETDFADETGNSARGVGTAREAKDKYFVGRCPICG